MDDKRKVTQEGSITSAYCIISSSRMRTAVYTPSSRTALLRDYHLRENSSTVLRSGTVSSGSVI